MKQTYSDEAGAEQPDEFAIRKLSVTLSDAFVRLAARDRAQVMRLLEQFAFGKDSLALYRESWSRDNMKSCCQQMQLVSPEVANALRRWGSELLKAEYNDKWTLKCLIDQLTFRTWFEEP